MPPKPGNSGGGNTGGGNTGGGNTGGGNTSLNTIDGANNVNDVLLGTADEDLLRGFSGDDVIFGAGGEDIYEGGKGNDSLIASVANDTMDGGLDYDRALYREASIAEGVLVEGQYYSVFGYDIQISGNTTTVTDTDPGDGDTGTDTLIDVEELVLSDDDADGDGAASLLTIYLDGRNNDPLGVADYAATSEDTAILIDGTGLIANDLEFDGDTKTLVSVQDAVNGTAVLNADGSILFQPDAHFSGDASFTYTVEDGVGGSDTQTVYISVAAVADVPTLSVAEASGAEDTAITLNISAALVDLDGSESLEIEIAGVPAGAILSAGIDMGGGVWLLQPGDLAGLTIMPPANSDDDFQLTVTARAREASNGDVTETPATIDVTVFADADLPQLSVSNALGAEDNAIPLNIAAALSDLDGSESLSVTIGAIPVGAVLSWNDGAPQSFTATAAASSVTITNAAQAILDTLSITPPADSDADFQLKVRATSSEARDDILDFVVAGGGGAAAILEGNGSLGFADTGARLANPTFTYGVTTGDVDGDGDIDVVLSGDNAYGRLYLNQGNGSFEDSGQLFPGQFQGINALVDLDNDGDLDLAFNNQNGAVNLYENDGLGGFTLAQSVDPAPYIFGNTSIVFGDVNADGYADLLVSVSDGPDALYLNDGTGQFTPSGQALGNGTSYRAAFGDLDGDGDLDLVTAGYAGTPTRVYLNDGAGGLVDTGQDIAEDATTEVVLGDVDGDGDLDAVVAGATQTRISFNQGDGNFSVAKVIAAEGGRLELADFDNDGDLDLARISGTTIAIYENDGSGTFTAAGQTASLFSTSALDSSFLGETAWTEGAINVTVAAVADAPSLVVADTSGNEDTAIALDITAALTDLDGSETLEIEISGVPAGAVLSAGIDLGGGVWRLQPGDLAGLTITPPADSDVEFQLTVTARSTEGANGDTAETSAPLTVTVAAVADAPSLNVANTFGQEDTAIPLSISAGLGDTDGSESLEIEISGVPAGAVLSAGTDLGGGVWLLQPPDLAGLTITPPGDGDDDFLLTVTARATEGANGDRAETMQVIQVAVASDADAPSLTLQAASEDAGNAIALDIAAALTDLDGSERLVIEISGLPAGAILSAGIDRGDGVWLLQPADLTGLTLTAADGSEGDYQLTVRARSIETRDDFQDLVVAGFGSAAVLEGDAGLALDDSGLRLANPAATYGISVGDVDGDGNADIVLSGDNGYGRLYLSDGNGGYLDSGQRFPAQFQGANALVDIDNDGDLDLAFNNQNGAVDLYENDGLGGFMLQQSLDPAPAGSGRSNTSITFGDVNGDGFADLFVSVSAGNDVLYLNDGSGLFTGPGQLLGDGTSYHSAVGDLDSDGDLDLVTPGYAGTPSRVYLNDGSGGLVDSGQDIGVTDAIQVVLGDLDGDGDLDAVVASHSETMTWVNRGDGVFDAGDQIATFGGHIRLADFDSDGDLDLAGTAGSAVAVYENDGAGGFSLANTLAPLSTAYTLAVGPLGETAETVGSLDLTVYPSVNPPSLTVQPAAGDEDTAIALDIQATLVEPEATESLEIEIAGVPAGAVLSAGADQGGGVWLLQPGDLAGLKLTPPADSDADFQLIVTARGIEGANGATAESSAAFDVTVTAVADVSSLVVSNAAGDEDTAISLDITAALVDTDGSETLEIEISGMPTGAQLSAGVDQGGGVWLLHPADLAGLTITPPPDSDAEFVVRVTARTTEAENGDSAESSASVLVTVDAVADAPIVNVQPAVGNEDSAIPLFIDVQLADSDGSETLTAIAIFGVPFGAVLSAGVNEGSFWRLTPDDLVGLTITPPPDSSSDFFLRVFARSDEIANGDVAGTQEWLEVRVIGVADAPILSVANAFGQEDTAIPLQISAPLTDTDGSESLEIEIAGVPGGATLSAGTDIGGGTWLLQPADLADLTLTPAPGSDADFALTVTARAKEGENNSFAETTGVIQVTVAAEADAPLLSVVNASGAADTAIALDITAAPGDGDGSESLFVTIGGIPEGATLIWNDGGVQSFTATGSETSVTIANTTQAILDTLTITPPPGSEADFQLSVWVQAREAQDDIPDLVVAGQDFVAAILEGDGAFGFIDSGERLPVSPNVYSVSTGDLDGDGDNDVVFSGDSGDGRLYLNQGDGSFEDSGQLFAGQFQGVNVLVDLDNDGDLDLAFNNNFGAVDLYENDGLGGFTLAANVDPAVGSNTSVALGDVNGDGFADLFVAVSGGNDLLYLNDGAGGFAGPGASLGGGTSFHSGFGDLDGDGDLDLVTAGYSGTPTRIYLNDGSGGLVDTGQDIGEDAATSAVLGDIDGDGDLDAVVAGSTQTRVWLNQGNGVFSAGTVIAAAGGQLELADIDADGDLDLARATGSSVVFYENDGAGSFAEVGSVSPLATAYSLDLGYLGEMAESTALLDVTVTAGNSAPLAVDSLAATNADQEIEGVLTASDDPGDSLTYSQESGPANGSLIVNPNGSYHYMPNASFTGEDSFSFRVSDQVDAFGIATVSISVAQADDADVAAIPAQPVYGDLGGASQSIYSSPSVAVLADGGYVVVWRDLSTNEAGHQLSNIMWQRFDATGQALNSGFTVENEFNGGQRPHVAALSDGGWVLVWDKLGYVLGQAFNADGAPATENFEIVGGGPHEATVVSTGTDTFAIAYSTLVNNVSTGYDVHLATFTLDPLAQGEPTLLADYLIGDLPESNSSADQGLSRYGESLTTLADGRLAVTWTDYEGLDGDRAAVFAEIRNADGSAIAGGGPVLMNVEGLSVQHEPSIGALAGGGFVVVWSEPNSDENGVTGLEGRIVYPDGSMSAQFKVDPADDGIQAWQHSVLGLSDGGFVVTFVNDWALCLQRFDGDGMKIGEMVTVDDSAGSAYQASVDELPDGGLVVTWMQHDHTVSPAYDEPLLKIIPVEAFASAKSLTGSPGNDSFIGSSLGDLLAGDEGDDLLWGLAGDDTLEGGVGNDLLDGGTGSDFILGGAGADEVVLRLGDGSDVLAAADLLGDFEDEMDFFSLKGGLAYGDLLISDDGAGNAVISHADSSQHLLVVLDTSAVQITEEDFVVPVV